jgi:hypothetical protein
VVRGASLLGICVFWTVKVICGEICTIKCAPVPDESVSGLIAMGCRGFFGRYHARVVRLAKRLTPIFTDWTDEDEDRPRIFADQGG